MPNIDSYIPDTLAAIVETSEHSDDELFSALSDVTAVHSQKINLYHDITLEPMMHADVSFSMAVGMPETIVEESEEEDNSSCDDSIIADKKDNTNHRLSTAARKTAIGNMTQWANQLSVSDFETGSIALFNFDDSSSDDETTSTQMDQSSSSSKIRSSNFASNIADDILSWRLDSTESMSDWSIRVHNIHSNTSQEYHVHRNMLAVGQRKSAFFVDLFKRRHAERVTEFYFGKDAAEYVPMVLDWVYVGDSAIQLSTDSAPCLRYLAQCFGLRRLFDQAMTFMKADLSTESLAAYYAKAVVLEDQKILNVVARFFARKIDHIETSNEIMKQMTPGFFLHILSQPGLDRPESLVHKNLMISSYCFDHKQTLTDEDFLHLTHEKYLPRIHYGAAIQLLELELDLAPGNVAKDNQEMKPTSLQKRCIDAIAPRWKEAVEIQRVAIENILKRLPSFLVTMLLLEALQMASQDLEHQTKQAEAEAMDLRKRVKARMKASYDGKIKRLHEICKQKDEEILVRNQEMARFVRLPNCFDGRLTASKSSTKPFEMPKLGTHEPAGYILTSRKQVGTNFPLFYYK